MISDDKYIDKYRQKLAQMTKLQEDSGKISRQLDKCHIEMAAVQSELRTMRRIISTMIDNGIDHVEAKLRLDASEHVNTIWTDANMDMQAAYPLHGSPTGILSGLSLDNINTTISNCPYPTVTTGPFGNP